MNKKILLLFSLLAMVAFSFSTMPALAGGFKPSDIYKQYLARVYYARSLYDVAPYFINRTRNNMLSLEGEAAQKQLEKLKKSYIGKFTVKKEEVVGDMAFIEATGYAKDWGQVTKATVRVEMLRESGAWKIKHHSWSGKVRPPKGQIGKTKKSYR